MDEGLEAKFRKLKLKHLREKYRIRLNEEISAPYVRVIGGEGIPSGLMKREEALRVARQARLDLVQLMQPVGKPPSCRIVDFKAHTTKLRGKATELSAKKLEKLLKMLLPRRELRRWTDLESR